MDKDLIAYLDLRFKNIEDRLDALKAQEDEAHHNIHGRIDGVCSDQKALTSRLWGLASAVLIAFVGTLWALATGHKP